MHGGLSMKYFFPDSQDFVDPDFDFITEKRDPLRVRQRDDAYAHQMLNTRPYDGLLISKAMVEGVPGKTSKTRYSEGQKYRLYREGANRYFRLGKRFEVMGDSGAFSYANEEKPPYSTDDLIEFYSKTKVNHGVSLDHIVFGFRDENSRKQSGLPSDKEERVGITLENAENFILRKKEFEFTPYGVAQGWDTDSYVQSSIELVKMGYEFITLGGIVTMDSSQIVRVLDEIVHKTNRRIGFHLLGIGRLDNLEQLRALNVLSIDSTTPLKQAFMDDKHNYHFKGIKYCAIRIPQSENNIKVKRIISSGRLSQKLVKERENTALTSIRLYDVGKLSIDETLESILAYEDLFSERRELLLPHYRKTLLDKPWKKCRCTICKKIGVEVIIYRGSERNKRRGFHNLHDFYSALLRNKEDAKKSHQSEAR